jgi:hypothetical protein
MEDGSPESPELKNNQRKSTRGTRGKHGGRRSGAGRKKGVPNKLTADVKAAIIEAFSKVGGAEYLLRLARSDPRTFCTLFGKVLPTQVTGDPNNPVHAIDRIEFVVVDPKEPPSPKGSRGLASTPKE